MRNILLVLLMASPCFAGDIVKVYATSRYGSSQGTGFCVGNARGISVVMTASHVLHTAHTVSITKGETSYPAKIAHCDGWNDISLLVVKTQLDAFDVSSDMPRPGVRYRARGYISKDQMKEVTVYLKGTVYAGPNVIPGMSGGPVTAVGSDVVVGVIFGYYQEGDKPKTSILMTDVLLERALKRLGGVLSKHGK